MSKEDERIDRRMVPRGQADVGEGPWWRPSLLTGWFLALVAIDALILLIASGVTSSGSDAAGNGLANAFQTAFVQAGALLVGCLTLLFVVVRHKGTRIGLTVMLGLVTLPLPMLLR
jgi:hypothetical protein